MGSYNTNEFRSGLKIILDGGPYTIIENEFVKPGKGQAFNRVRLYNLISGKLLEKTFKSGNSVKAADVININLIYLYNDREFWNFMHNETFEQFVADAKVVGHNAKWLVEQSECEVTLWNNYPIIITPPNFVELEITETDPILKGNAASSGCKFAKLTTGAIMKVPLFIQIGQVIKVDTRSGEYVSRIK
ncbi:MAG: elongation factor P [Sodalis sp. (in: enterobacteria)]